MPDLIKLVFGDSDFKYKGEYLCDIWGLEFQNQKFVIVSANGRGTTIESLQVDTDIIKSFYDSLVHKFTQLDNPKIEKLKIFLN